MDNLPDWALWIITAAAGLSPGLALILVSPIARLLHRMLWPRPEAAPPPSVGQARSELADTRLLSLSATAATNAG